MKSLVVFFFAVALMGSCAKEETGKNLQADTSLTGSIGGSEWTMKSGDARTQIRSGSRALVNIKLSDSSEYISCKPNGMGFDRRVSILVPAQTGKTDLSQSFGAVTFIHPQGDSTLINTASQGTVTISAFTNNSLTGSIDATAYDGERVKGPFTVALCP